MKLRPALLWRCAAAVLWIVSAGCLIRAVGEGVTAEESLYNPSLTDMDRVAIQQESVVSGRWNDAGWTLQVIAAALLALGIEASRVVRRIFISLGIFIAADGLALLLIAVMIHT